jgi:DNA-binding NarL/FixJ family response regulator
MKILLIEDHPVMISGCRRVLAEKFDADIVHANTLVTASTILEHFVPDVAIVDALLPDGSGIEFIEEILRTYPRVAVIVFSAIDDATLAIQAIDFGATGFVSKFGEPDDLIAAVGAASRGEAWVSAGIAQQMALRRTFPGARPKLSDREMAVLRLLSSGRRTHEIANDLDLSTKTVRSECASMRQKLNARTDAEMIAIAVRSVMT